MTWSLMQGGYTALIVAAMLGHVNVVQYLVGVGANFEAATSKVSGKVLWEYVDVLHGN